MPRQRLGDVLKLSGAVSERDLEVTIQEQLKQEDRSVRLGELLLQKGLVSKEQLSAALQQVTRIPYEDCTTLDVEYEALEFMSYENALRYCCLPVALRGQAIVLVMKEPQNLQVLDELRFITGMEISPRLGFEDDIKEAIQRYYKDEPFEEAEIHPYHTEASSSAEETGPGTSRVDSGNASPDGSPEMEFISASTRQGAKDAVKEMQAAMGSKTTPAVRLVSNIISVAYNKKASDIHIDPQASGMVARVRVDGVLRDVLQVPAALSTQLVSRIKIISDLDIAERRAPQDGRFMVRIGDKRLDLRVSTLPTNYGEKVVMRLLNPESTKVSFANLGFSEAHSQALGQALKLPQGLILVCGPTGSGKTTTLYAALNQLSTRSVNIVTVEDPIEYMLAGINQVQVNKKAGLTFASTLRSILRQDPNIVMVGEIRDQETAEIAMTASQTGHLVLSTLHTNDSIATLDRLRDLGIPAFMIAASVTAIVSQRLLRKLCTCRVEGNVPIPPEYPELLAAPGSEPIKIYVPGGCPACDYTGYRGRVGVYEVLFISDDIRRLIQKDTGTEEIRTWTAAMHVPFMRENALDKVKEGLTSLDEVLRVVPMTERAAPVKQSARAPVNDRGKEHSVRYCHECGAELAASFSFCPGCGSKVRGLSIAPKPTGTLQGDVPA